MNENRVCLCLFIFKYDSYLVNSIMIVNKFLLYKKSVLISLISDTLLIEQLIY